MKKPRDYLKLLPAILYVGFIWFLSSLNLGTTGAGSDKIAHIIEYSILGVLLCIGMPRKYVLFAGILLGAMDEVHQYFVPYRTADIMDVMADGVGIFVGMNLVSAMKLYQFALKAMH